MSQRILGFWSGGKDSCFALMQAVTKGEVPVALLNMINENGKVFRLHGIPFVLLRKQAKAMNLPIANIPATLVAYEKKYIEALIELKTTYQVDAAVFGDIDIFRNRTWEEKVSAAAGLKAQLPLWQRNRRQLVIDMIESGIEGIIVSCNTELGVSFLGRKIALDLIDDLEAIGVDACGENGEYHTLVMDCPLFRSPITVPPYTKKVYKNYCFLT